MLCMQIFFGASCWRYIVAFANRIYLLLRTTGRQQLVKNIWKLYCEKLSLLLRTAGRQQLVTPDWGRWLATSLTHLHCSPFSTFLCLSFCLCLSLSLPLCLSFNWWILVLSYWCGIGRTGWCKLQLWIHHRNVGATPPTPLFSINLRNS